MFFRFVPLILTVLIFTANFFVGSGLSNETPSKSPTATNDDQPLKQSFQGRVVFTHEALKRRGVKAYAEELKDQVALETKNEVIPILPDWRGRAFYQDKRLRDRDVELIGFRREGLPYLNVLTVYTFDEKGRRQYTDYWCDVCSIPMYEIKPCDCCQQEIRLRFGEDKEPK